MTHRTDISPLTRVVARLDRATQGAVTIQIELQSHVLMIDSELARGKDQ